MTTAEIESTAKYIILQIAWDFEDRKDFGLTYLIACKKFQDGNIELTEDEIKKLLDSLKIDGYIQEHPSNVRLTAKGKDFLIEKGYKP